MPQASDDAIDYLMIASIGTFLTYVTHLIWKDLTCKSSREDIEPQADELQVDSQPSTMKSVRM